MEVLQAKNLKKIYGSGNNAVHALDGVDLSVKKGDCSACKFVRFHCIPRF